MDTAPWEQRGWDALARTEVAPGLACDHFQILQEPQVATVGRWLREGLLQPTGPQIESNEA